MMRLHRILALVFLALGFFKEASCTRQGPREILFWHSMGGEKGKVLERFVERYNALPGVAGRFAVRPQFVGSYEEALNHLRAALMAGQSPHIAQIYDIGTGLMIDSGAVRPLQDFIDKDPEFPRQEILPQASRYYSVGKRLWALPFASSNPILYYNEEMLKKAGLSDPPKTFEELISYAEKLTDREKRITGLTWPLTSWLLEEFFARNGVSFLEPNNGRSARAMEANYLDAVGLTYFSTIRDLSARGVFANLGRAWDPPVQSFLAGRSAMLVTSTSDVLIITKNASFTVKTAPIVPLQDYKDKAGGTVVGGNALWILSDKSEEEQKVAYGFLKYVASKPAQREWHTSTGYFPIRGDVIKALEGDGYYTTNPNARTAIDQLLASAPGVATEGARTGVFMEARDHLETAAEEILAQDGGSKPAEALQKAKRRTDEALARYARVLLGQGAEGKVR